MSGNKISPEGWAIATIGNLIGTKGIFKDGDWVESKDQDPNGGVRLIQLADIGDGKYVNKSSRFLTKDKAIDLRCTFLQGGDVLVARMPEPLGRACIFPGDEKQSVTVVDVCILRTSYVNHQWLQWFINAPKFRAVVASLQRGSTRKRISRKNLGTIRLPIPPLNEQHRIVNKIDELFSDLDAGVAALERVQKALKRYRASVLKAAVEGRLTAQWRAEHPDVEPASELLKRILTERRLKWEVEQLSKYDAAGKNPPKNWQSKYTPPVEPDTTDLPELPKGWCWATLDAISHITGGITKGQKRKNAVKKRIVPYLRVANVQRGYLDLGVIKTDLPNQ